MPRKGFSKPISRRCLSDLFAINRRTQARYEKRHNKNRAGKLKRRINFQILHGLYSRHLRGARENIHSACFMWGDKVAKPLPNSYQSGLKTSRGRLKKANRSLRSLVCIGAGASVPEPKVFYGSAKEWSQVCRRQQTKTKNIARAFPLSALIGYRYKHSACGIYYSSDAISLISDQYSMRHQ